VSTHLRNEYFSNNVLESLKKITKINFCDFFKFILEMKYVVPNASLGQTPTGFLVSNKFETPFKETAL